MRVAMLISLLISAYSYSQVRPIGKVYIVEGVVADRETLLALPAAILYNDSLGITTTTDENGYFKIVVPHELVKNRGLIPITIVKPGYKRWNSGFSYNPAAQDTAQSENAGGLVWNYDIKIFWLAKEHSNLFSTSSAHAAVKQGVYGYAATRRVFDEAVAADIRNKKFDKLKHGNDYVYFPLDGVTGLATSRYDIIVIGKFDHVFINDKKVNVDDINNVVKRNEIRYDTEHSNALTKKYGKETLAFVTIPPSEANKSTSAKNILIIEIDN